MVIAGATDRAFDVIFARFDAQNTGSINTKDFLNIIDELDALQPEQADPIISEDQRMNALQVVDAGLAMSKTEVLEFLEELGVNLDNSPRSEESSQPKLPTKINSLDSPRESPLSFARSRANLLPRKPERTRRPLRTTAPDLSAIDFAAADTSLFSDPELRLKEVDHDTRRASSPLAQSTPQKDSSHMKDIAEKENRRPQSSPEKAPIQSVFSAVAQGSFSPASMSSQRSFSASFNDNQELRQLQDEIRSLQDREKTSDRAIAAGEHQIHHLEALLEENRKELSRSNKAVTDLKSSFMTAEHNIHLLEKDVEEAHHELTSWQQRYARSKEEIEDHILESEKLKSACQDRNHKIDMLQAKIASADEEHRLWNEEKHSLLAQISGLEIQCDKLENTEVQLSEALEACHDWEQQVEQLKYDIEQIKQASLKAPRIAKTQTTRSGVEGHDTQPIGTISKTTGTQACPMTRNSAIQTEGLEGESQDVLDQKLTSFRTEPDQSLTHKSSQDEMMKQHYATLSNELGLQRNLIDKMIKLKSGSKKARSRSRTPGISTVQATQVPEMPSLVAVEPSRKVSDQLTTWPILILYSLIFVLLGYLIASRMSVTSTSGVSYAELKAWERANSITYLLDHHGVLGAGGPYRWWEGRWTWLEMAGFWLEGKLQDRAWPS